MRRERARCPHHTHEYLMDGPATALDKAKKLLSEISSTFGDPPIIQSPGTTGCKHSIAVKVHGRGRKRGFLEAMHALIWTPFR